MNQTIDIMFEIVNIPEAGFPRICQEKIPYFFHT